MNSRPQSHRHFFIVGAQRSGTTYLYQILDEHPEIEMNQPSFPEPKFFLAPGSELKQTEYLQRFYSTKEIVLRGEKSTSYIESEDAARRISQAFPDATLIFILRDPIERAVSNYWLSVQYGVETLPIDEALLADLDTTERPYEGPLSVSPFRYLKRGRYNEFLELYLQYFKRDQLKLLVFENFVGNRKAVSDLYQDLGVSNDFCPKSLNEQINANLPSDQKMKPQTLNTIADYFAKSNLLLANEFNLDLSSWKGSTAQGTRVPTAERKLATP